VPQWVIKGLHYLVEQIECDTLTSALIRRAVDDISKEEYYLSLTDFGDGFFNLHYQGINQMDWVKFQTVLQQGNTAQIK
jgi:hypothetical protein